MFTYLLYNNYDAINIKNSVYFEKRDEYGDDFKRGLWFSC